MFIVVFWVRDAFWFAEKRQDKSQEQQYTKEAGLELVNTYLGRDRDMNTDIIRCGKRQAW